MNTKTVSRHLLVDPISIFFIKFQSLFGVIRLPIIYDPNSCQKALMMMYISFMVAGSNIFPACSDKGDTRTIKVFLRLFESSIFYIYGFTLNSKFKQFFVKIGRINTTNGLFERKCVRVVLIFNLCCLSLLSYRKSIVNNVTPLYVLYVAPLRIAHSCEHFFFGHLLNGFRVKLNYATEQIFSSWSSSNKSKSRTQLTICIIKKVTNRYLNLIQAFDILIECIQWQVFALTIVTTSIILDLMQDIATRVIEKSLASDFWSVLVMSCMVLAYVLPQIFLCACAVSVTNSVNRLKTLLTVLLFNKQFDKQQKIHIKTLLSLIRNKPLTFSLMGMFNIDTTLLLKIIHFLFTYLFIILQFKKLNRELS